MGRVVKLPKAARDALRSMPWAKDAKCKTAENPDAFFPIAEQESATAYAKGLCALCPVAIACLRWALDNGMDKGIWGGLTEKERRELKGLVKA